MDVQKTVITAATVALGVIAAGYVMKMFGDIGIIDTARNGFSKGL